MRKILSYRNFITVQINKQIPLRLFLVFIFLVSFQTLFSASIKRNIPLNEAVKLSCTSKISLEIFSGADLNILSDADSTKKSPEILTPVTNKRLHLSANTSIQTESFAKDATPKYPQQAEIFVSSGVTVIGLENIYNTKVITGKENIKPQNVQNSASPTAIQLDLAKKVAKVKADQAKKFKNLRKIEIFTFYSDPLGNSDIKKKSASFIAAVISPFQLSQKSAISNSTHLYNGRIDTEVKKQKTATFLCNLQFRKYRSSSLRGPPIYC